MQKTSYVSKIGSFGILLLWFKSRGEIKCEKRRKIWDDDISWLKICTGYGWLQNIIILNCASDSKVFIKKCEKLLARTGSLWKWGQPILSQIFAKIFWHLGVKNGQIFF